MVSRRTLATRGHYVREYGAYRISRTNIILQAIENLDSNEHEIFNLLKSQTNVIKTTIANFNNTITNLNSNEQVFNRNLEILSNYTKHVDGMLFNLDLKQDIDGHLSFLTLVTSEVNNEISMIINAILFSKNNALHPVIITPEQYIFELRKTVSHFPLQTKYPLSLTINDAPELLSLIDLVSYIMNDKLDNF